MGYDPDTQQLHEITPEFLSKLTPAEQQKIKTSWAKFREGDIVHVRPQTEIGVPFRCAFRITELGKNRMVLVPVGAP